jgi:4-hydroxy-3-methylbut-2-enyl diphosphate reductase
MIRVVLAQPRGFCAGVERAIEIVERALKKYGPPIYVRHEIVHNRHVVEDLRTRGAVFVDELDEIPPGSMTVFSAHGVAKRVEEAAAERGLPTIDATCPLVAKVHNEGRRYARQDREIVLVGHAGHAEVEGTIGQVPAKVHLVQTVEDVDLLTVKDPDKLAYITQTTLSVDDTRGIISALTKRFPTIVGPDARYLLCHAEPPAGGARSGARGRHDPGRGVAQFVQLQPPAGDWSGTRQALVPYRRRGCVAGRVV